MSPKEFVDKWSAAKVRERQGSQEHFIDLCRLLGEETPVEADPDGDWYCFEKGAAKTGGGDGWADVWKQGCFGWEYKGKLKDLEAALKQLKLYQGALNNPPLLIVSDMDRIEVHTAFTNMVQEKHVFALEDLLDANNRRRLKNVFSEAGAGTFKPQRKRSELTADIAGTFVDIAKSLRQRGHAPDKVAHFINRMVFCMFAEDVDLLPDRVFTKLLTISLKDPPKFQKHAQKLFSQMREGGEMDMLSIEWFNGGLFDDGSALPLEKADIERALAAAKEDWSNIDPSIMGTLFERGLDPDKRSQLGAHYTDPEKIMMIVRPVIIEPLAREWDGVKAEMEKLIADAPKATKDKLLRGAELAARTRALNKAEELHRTFIDRLKAFRILDPACGSGNFLFLGLKALKDIEHRVNTECEVLGLPRGFPVVGPECMLGIEINPFAAELARVSVWIGEIQWMREHGFDATRNPILKPLDNIACHDALLDDKGGEYKWPKSDAIIGNPPFLGGKRLRESLGGDTVERMFRVYEGRVPAEADLVCYWFARAREKLEKGKVGRVGLVCTNSIRGGANRDVLDAIEGTGRIFEAWSDEPWVVDGAAVRVSIVCFDGEDGTDGLKLDGQPVAQINSDLTSGATNLTRANRLKENRQISFQGPVKVGPFDVAGQLARQWLAAPRNPNRRFNADVVKPWANGFDVLRRPADKWILDFGDMEESSAALYELPFQYVLETIKPMSGVSNRQTG